ncbi:hypothetical protein PspLS_03474 [Pyricularia sp. CBS 133598]|nr:hypothetical protein PspLS_03474 [Pyricularia sp. CBS 133598]
MPAPIVYDGVGGGGGRDDLLFSGIKFWLALRVPSRTKFKEKIQSNGGEVVPMERQADILIADDAAPKKAPSNWDSYSWKFIDAAIEKGELPDKEDYLIPRSTSAATRAPIPANGGSKGTRTPFTAEDDRILTKCARRQLGAPQGAGMKGSLKGNAFWVDFATKNPRHTTQSWRDRWLKKLAHLPGNDQPLDSEPEETTTHASMEPTDLVLAQSGPRPKSPQLKSNPQVPNAKASTIKEGGRQKFTPAEDEALIEAVDEARRLGENIGGKLFYEEFAKAAHHEDSTESADDLEDPPTPEAQNSQLRETRTPSPQPPKSTGDGESMEGYHSQSQTPTTPTHNRHPGLRSDEVDAYHEFYDLLGEYARSNPNTINTKPRISGVRIDLFRLQQAVESQDGDLEECDWSLVCKDIGFKSPDPELAKAVEACYGTNLQGFIKAYSGFEEGHSEVASSESDLGSRLVDNQHKQPESDTVLPQASSPGHEEHRGSDNDELAAAQFRLASSPTPRHLGKRQRTREVVNGRRKRTRLSRDVEIPDTPQVTLKFRHQTAFDNPENSVNEEDEDEEGDDFQATYSLLDNTPSQQLRSELDQSVSGRNSKQTSSQDHPTAQANGRLNAQVVEIGEPSRYAAHDRLPKRGHLPEAPAATRINKDLDAKVASSRTVSRVSTRQTQGPNRPPRSAQPPPIPVRSTPVKKALHSIKEAPVRHHVFSTPKTSERPMASNPMGMSSPLASIPNDILSDIISSPGHIRQISSFARPSASSRRAPDSSRRPPAQRNSLASLHHQPQNILPSIEGGHESIISNSRCSEQVKCLTALGYRQEFIDKLLHATSRDVTVMKKVCELKAQKKSKGHGASGPSESMPNMRGVWTAEEDRKLVKIYEFNQMDEADKAALSRRTREQDERVLKQKHGWEGALDARMRFLQRQS